MRLDNICKSYGEKAVLKDFSAVFPNGGFSWVMGQSGCGKTTLLRIIAGLEDYSGSITQLPEGGISMVFQEDRLFDPLSALENCALVSDKSGCEIRKMLISTGLSEDDITRPTEVLSGGMKRRTAIVRAMCRSCGILLMDEPFRGIDSENRIKTAKMISRNISGKTVIAVTHDITDTRLIKGNILHITP